MKESLSPEEVVMAVVMHRDGAENQQIARWFGINQGRISEAIQAMEWASQNHRQVDPAKTGLVGDMRPIPAGSRNRCCTSSVDQTG